MADDPAWVAYTAFGLSIISTFRPELETLYKRIMLPVKPTVEETPSAEIGFNLTGSYVKTAGVILVSNGSIIVRKMQLVLTRASDGATRTYDAKWYLATHGDPAAVSADIRLPTAFAVDDEKPEPYMVFFAYKDEVKRMMAAADDLLDAWNEFQSGAKSAPAAPAAPTFPTPYFVPQNPWEIFKAQQSYADCTHALEAAFFWTPGDFRVDLTVETASDRGPLTSSSWFTVRAADVKHLKTLVDYIPTVICGLADPKTQWPAITVDTRAQRTETAEV